MYLYIHLIYILEVLQNKKCIFKNKINIFTKKKKKSKNNVKIKIFLIFVILQIKKYYW